MPDTASIEQLKAEVQYEKEGRERRTKQRWPDPDTLAMVAAQARFAGVEEAEAVRQALSLRQAARDVLEAARENWREESKKWRMLPAPKQWPATLTDFYKLIVRCKVEKENPSRFKRFLLFRAEGRKPEIAETRIDGQKIVHTFKSGTGEQPPTQSAEAAEKAAERQLVEYQTAQFNQETWIDLARDYELWWEWKYSENKRQAGQARAAKAAADKKAKGKKNSIEDGGVKVTGVKAGVIKLTKKILK